MDYKLRARIRPLPHNGIDITETLGSNLDISQKCKMGDISKGVASALLPAKKYRY
jgi:hypothetical protein